MQLQIDKTRCEGHGRCYVLFPELFDADDMGDGEVRQGDLGTPERIADAETAVLNCPERAISLTP